MLRTDVPETIEIRYFGQEKILQMVSMGLLSCLDIYCDYKSKKYNFVFCQCVIFCFLIEFHVLKPEMHSRCSLSVSCLWSLYL